MNSGKADPEFVEYIVAEVLRRLRQQGVSVASEVVESDRDLVLEDHVVALAKLNGRLANVRRVVVKPRAVVTPAVKDELKEKGVELVRR